MLERIYKIIEAGEPKVDEPEPEKAEEDDDDN
jgi:hypothetical protein